MVVREAIQMAAYSIPTVHTRSSSIVHFPMDPCGLSSCRMCDLSPAVGSSRTIISPWAGFVQSLLVWRTGAARFLFRILQP